MLKNSDVTVMVSDSRDGEYVARLSRLYGIKTMRGSSSKGAAKAIREGLKLLLKNKPIAITPDGPRGPRYKIQAGLLGFAASGNAPILPLHIEASRQWVLRSWDRHRFPKPFSTIHVGFGIPTRVEQQRLVQQPDEVTREIEELMMANVNFLKQQARAG